MPNEAAEKNPTNAMYVTKRARRDLFPRANPFAMSFAFCKKVHVTTPSVSAAAGGAMCAGPEGGA
jgi:hypothetical protein